MLIGLAALGLAAYWLFAPITFLASNGQYFGCGRASSPPTETFPKNICGELPSVYRTRAIVTAVVALAIAGVGAALFGFDRSTEQRRRPRDDRDERADDDAWNDPDSDARLDSERPNRAGVRRAREEQDERYAREDDYADRPAGRRFRNEDGAGGRRRRD